MEQLTETEWEKFHQMVEAVGPSSFFEDSSGIVFRGGTGPYTIDYVRKPYRDALKSQSLLDEDPEFFEDTGIHTIFLLAKSVEMHMRLFYLGGKKEDFENKSFTLSKCAQAVRNGEAQFNGFGGKKVEAKGAFWANFRPEDNRRHPLVNLAFQIYEAGNPYRHNMVRPWVEVSPKFNKIISKFEKFIEIFDQMVE